MSRIYPWLTERKRLLLEIDGHDIDFDEVTLMFKKNDKGHLVLMTMDGIRKGSTIPMNPWYLDLLLGCKREEFVPLEDPRE